MQGRRVTALLLTAFLVAQLLWRWQFGAIMPASSSGSSWSEVASGAYVADGTFLLPQAQGPVLRRSGQGWVQSKPTWQARWQGVEVDLYGQGAGQIAVAGQASGVQVLPRYSRGFLLRDTLENLWLVQRGRVKLLLGGGQGAQSRQAFLNQTASLERQGAIPSGWQAIWAAEPMPVGTTVWYLSNRDGQPGITPPHIFRLTGSENGPIAALTPLGNLRLLSAGKDEVVAADATGEILRIDASSGAVQVRRSGLLVLAAGPGGRLALWQTAPSGNAKLEITEDGLKTLLPVRLPKGVQAVGPAAFSTHGHWLVLLGRGSQGLVAAVARLDGREVSLRLQPIVPPAGTQIDPAMPVSISDGVLYLTTKQGQREQTWSRPLDSTGPMARAGVLGHTRRDARQG